MAQISDSSEQNPSSTSTTTSNDSKKNFDEEALRPFAISHKAASSIPASYLARTLIIVSDSAAAANQMLSRQELDVKAKIWADLLYRIIPEDRLDDAFREAFRTHSTPFAVNAYDVKLAYERLRESDPPEWEVAIRACKVCNSKGYVEVELGRWAICRHGK